MKLKLLLSFLLIASHSLAADIVVSAGQSIHEAVRQAREWRRTHDPRCEGGITVRLQAGRYYMDEPLLIRPEDSGTPDSPTRIVGEAGTVICGDAPQRHTQLWPREGMSRLLAFNVADRTVTIPTPPRQVLKAKHLEMVVHQRWAIAILRVKDMKVQGAETVVSFLEPESRLEFEHPWPQPVIDGEKGSSSFLLRTTEQRQGVEQLVVVAGTADTPVSNITFEGITFEHTCWNRPLRRGHVTLQGGFPLVDAYKLQQEGLPWDAGLENQAWIERPVAAVSVDHAEQVDFKQCCFQHLAATALDLGGNTRNCLVQDNNFEDIGGTAIMVGSFAESPREVHRPYQDLTPRHQCITIAANTIHDATNEDWGAVAISCGYVSYIRILRNHVSHVNYSGICVGWGWTPEYTGMECNQIVGNRVEDYARQLYDAGGIYTLSNQPGSLMADNDISQPFPAPYATNDRGFCIYLDARTDGYLLQNNRTAGRLIRRDEIGDNHPGPNLSFNP